MSGVSRCVIRSRFLHPLFFLLACAALLGACVAADAGAHARLDPPPPKGAPSATPFEPPPTEPPAALSLWLSPALPRALRRAAQEAWPQVTFVDDEAGAQVSFAPQSEGALGEWVYALVAAFPTVQDSISWEEVQTLWRGESAGRLYATQDAMAALQAVLGLPDPASVQALPADEIMDRLWGESEARAIVPFDELEPHLKVIALDGISPLDQDFSGEGYPLAIRFGLEGSPAMAAALGEAFGPLRTNRDPARMTTLIMTGVTALARTTAWKMSVKGVDYPAERIRPWLVEADLTHVSNEVSFSRDCPPPDPYATGLKFCSQWGDFRLLEDLDIDLVELTGNHNLDWGPQAALDSLDLYRQAGMATFGGGENLTAAREPALVEHHGNRFAFLGCNAVGPPKALAGADSPGAAPCDLEALAQQVRGLRAEGYLPIVTFQWAEGAAVVPQQREAFEGMAAAGAVIVSGSQAHEPLGFAFPEGAFVHFGLGNLFFDQMQSYAMREEFIDRHIFYDGRHISTVLLTALLEDFAQPRPMSDAERAALLSAAFASSDWED